MCDTLQGRNGPPSLPLKLVSRREVADRTRDEKADDRDGCTREENRREKRRLDDEEENRTRDDRQHACNYGDHNTYCPELGHLTPVLSLNQLHAWC